MAYPLPFLFAFNFQPTDPREDRAHETMLIPTADGFGLSCLLYAGFFYCAVPLGLGAAVYCKSPY